MHENTKDMMNFFRFYSYSINKRLARVSRLYAGQGLNLRRMGYQDFLRTPYWREVSDIVKMRDRYKCTSCGSKKKLQVHHKVYDFRGFDHIHIHTLKTVCDDCHRRIHKIGREKR